MKNEFLPSAKSYKELTDRALEAFFLQPGDEALRGFAEAARYSLLAGGKRIRAMLVLEFCRISGGRPEDALDIACGVEMLHAYSLIHDDLPCMDNDDLRRGKPTNHIVYGECIATLAGDVLQAEAFRTVLHAKVSESAALRCARLLGDAVGLDGMCGGQYLDMIGEGKTLSARELDAINLRKTGALLAASCAMGVAAADGSREQEEAALQFGRLLGLAFQIRDDMLDVLSTSDELGKPVGSDREENKNTYMALLGSDACEREIRRLTEEAVEVLRAAFADTAFLEAFAAQLAERKN
ncbi:MAG: polyprenyl synthetase family protein [Oscillospiraceae bacterium]|nr:polyprenyl synthetase family protein [Oscillospiraceae bacterium]